MTTYLDTQRVLKVVYELLDDAVVHGISHAALCRFGERIERGEFDAQPGEGYIPVHIDDYNAKSKAMGEKDAEIARLKDEVRLRNYIIQKYCTEITQLKEACEYHAGKVKYQEQEIKDQHEKIKELMAELMKPHCQQRTVFNDVVDAHEAARGPEQDSVYQRLERLEREYGHIEKWCNNNAKQEVAMHDHFDSATKSLRVRVHSLEEKVKALEKGASYVLKVKDEKPAEPEMVICPHSKTCDQVGCCHKTPHEETPYCQSFCEYAPCDTSRCLPVKK